MQDNETKDRVMAIITDHATKAHASEYDRSVAISAIASARRTVEDLPLEPSGSENHGQTILDALNDLRAGYNDPDGKYTNGKGVLGSLIDDVYLMLSKQ